MNIFVFSVCGRAAFVPGRRMMGGGAARGRDQQQKRPHR